MNVKTMTSIPNEDLLFDDSSLLKAALGQEALKVSSVNANCDCIGYTTKDDEDPDTDQIAPTAD